MSECRDLENEQSPSKAQSLEHLFELAFFVRPQTRAGADATLYLCSGEAATAG